MKRFRFYKTQDNKWYIDLPDWNGSIEDLEMVMGADIMLDILSQGSDNIILYLSENEIDHYKYTLSKIREEFDGSTYIVEGNNITPFEAWLCSVTKFVFGYFPNKIYLT